MPTVATVRLRYSSQEYWFDPNGVGAVAGDHVVVKTVRGTEMGLCCDGGLDVDASSISKPLKPIVRVANEDDLRRADELGARSDEAMKTFRDLVDKHGLDMKPVDVAFMLDGEHATFFFTSEERVDFRALVRELASEYHVRVDMRQIGVRDVARMYGGIGHCGEELCCARMSGAFQPVSIRMAKDQDLPLNPSKISGLCGRLMCCLRYEHASYKDFKSRSPKKGALIETPAGLAKVVEFDMPNENVRVRFEDGTSMLLPVASLDTGGKEPKNGENIRPCHISQEKFDELIEQLKHDKTLAMMGEKQFSKDPALSDKTATAGEVSHNPQRPRRSSRAQGSSAGGSSRSRGKRRSQGASAPEPEKRDQRKRRRSVSVSTGESVREEGGAARTRGGAQQQGSGGSKNARKRSRSGNKQGQARSQGTRQGGAQNRGGQGSQQQRQQAQGKPRPGQHSSTVSGDAAREAAGQKKSSSGKRRRRRRGSGQNRQGQGGSGQGQGASGTQAHDGATSQGEHKVGE